MGEGLGQGSCCVAHHALPGKTRGAMWCLAEGAVPHSCGKHRHFQEAMTICFMGTKSKLCTATTIINPPHPSLFQAVSAPRVVPCPFCSEKPLASGSPWCCWAFPSPVSMDCGGAPFPWEKTKRAQDTGTAGSRCTSSKACGYGCVISSSFPNNFPLLTWHDTTCALPQADARYPRSGLQGPEAAAVNHSVSGERCENGVSQPSLL